MKNPNVIHITAVTDVLPEGQKCTRALVEYDTVLEKDSVNQETFLVEGRTVTHACVCASEECRVAENGRFAVLSLSPHDEAAPTYFPGSPWENIVAKVVPAVVKVRQKKEIRTEEGTVIPEWEQADLNDRRKNLLVDEFVQGSFEGVAYNLYIPENYDPSKKYPLVQFIHDAAVCSDNVKCTLSQGIGALSWMTKEAQKKHECFVLAPQFLPPSIVDDDWNVDHRLEVGKRLLDHIVSLYSIDTGRLYTTGQSMGCMSSMVLNLRYPQLFAASLFVAGQWDEQAFQNSGLEKGHFWFVNSQGDAKAFPGMNQILVELEQAGAKIAREVWSAKEEQSVYAGKTEKLLASGANILYTPFEMTTVADGWHSGGGEHHVHTWRYAYSIDAIHNWLFAQRK